MATKRSQTPKEDAGGLVLLASPVHNPIRFSDPDTDEMVTIVFDGPDATAHVKPAHAALLVSINPDHYQYVDVPPGPAGNTTPVVTPVGDGDPPTTPVTDGETNGEPT